jgi:probable HAF family extracellular repeat protein
MVVSPREEPRIARWPRIVLPFGLLALSVWACTEDRPTEPSTEVRTSTAAVATTYTVRDLGTLGGPSSGASDINNAGVVVGQSATGTGAKHAFRWQNGFMTDLRALRGGTNSAATAINRNGVIVGWSEIEGGATRAVRWEDGAKRNLGTLGGTASSATDINDSGWIVGYSLTQGGETHAFLWRTGVMTDLGTLGGSLSVATGINSAGAIVGYSTKAAGLIVKQFPFRWKDGVMHELPSLPGTATAISTFARPAAIVAGRIVGEGAPEEADGDWSHALMWDGRILTDLGFLGLGTGYARAEDVNSDGLVVGSVNHHLPDCASTEAFVWKDGEVTVLPWLGGENGFAAAAAINRTGLIVGSSETSTGSSDCVLGDVHATLWKPN